MRGRRVWSGNEEDVVVVRGCTVWGRAEVRIW